MTTIPSHTIDCGSMLVSVVPVMAMFLFKVPIMHCNLSYYNNHMQGCRLHATAPHGCGKLHNFGQHSEVTDIMANSGMHVGFATHSPFPLLVHFSTHVDLLSSGGMMIAQDKIMQGVLLQGRDWINR